MSSAKFLLQQQGNIQKPILGGTVVDFFFYHDSCVFHHMHTLNCSYYNYIFKLDFIRQSTPVLSIKRMTTQSATFQHSHGISTSHGAS